MKSQVKMHSYRLLIQLAILVLLTCGLSAAQSQEDTDKAVPLKERYIPFAPSPGTNVQGKVSLRIVVDAQGHVSESKALSGPEELIKPALAWVQKWQYEPPALAPVTKVVEISYGSRDCPGAISERGEIVWSWGLRDKNGEIIAVADNEDAPDPPYLGAERKSGVAGTMVLSITLNRKGYVKEIHVVKALSPALDKAVIDTVRPMKFRRLDRNPNASLRDLRLQLTFRATCSF